MYDSLYINTSRALGKQPRFAMHFPLILASGSVLSTYAGRVHPSSYQQTLKTNMEIIVIKNFFSSIHLNTRMITWLPSGNKARLYIVHSEPAVHSILHILHMLYAVLCYAVARARFFTPLLSAFHWLGTSILHKCIEAESDLIQKLSMTSWSRYLLISSASGLICCITLR